MKPHRLGVNPNYLAKRRIVLIGSLESKSTALIDAVDDLIGVESVSLDLKSGVLDISYDASKRQLNDILVLVEEAGVLLSDARWQKIKRSWYGYFDQSVKENAAEKPWSCH